MKKIEYFDCSVEPDMKKAEQILNSKNILKQEIVPFPYLMLIWDENV